MGGLIVLGIVVPIGLWLISALFAGGGVILAYAIQQGFLGVAVFIACWVFMLPVMLVVSLLVGFMHVGGLLTFLGRLYAE